MKRILIECWVEGVTPLLMHRATEEALSGDTRSNTPGTKEDPRVVAEKAVYRLDGALAIPGAAFARMIREAGGSHKARGSRKSVKYIVPAAVLVMDELCPLYLRDRRTPLVDFEVDSRPVTIPSTKGKVMRHRARANEWATRVTIRINEDILEGKFVHQLMQEGLEQIGIGDFRPEKGGPFGTALCVSWKEMTQRPATAATVRNGKTAGDQPTVAAE